MFNIKLLGLLPETRKWPWKWGVPHPQFLSSQQGSHSWGRVQNHNSSLAWVCEHLSPWIKSFPAKIPGGISTQKPNWYILKNPRSFPRPPLLFLPIKEHCHTSHCRPPKMNYMVVYCLPEAKGWLSISVWHFTSPHTFHPKFFKYCSLRIVLSRSCLYHASKGGVGRFSLRNLVIFYSMDMFTTPAQGNSQGWYQQVDQPAGSEGVNVTDNTTSMHDY